MFSQGVYKLNYLLRDREQLDDSDIWIENDGDPEELNDLEELVRIELKLTNSIKQENSSSSYLGRSCHV